MDALPVILRKDSVDLFTKYKVYSERELQSRLAILAENYVKTVAIEGKLTAFMAQTMILPAALRYQGDVADTVNATKAAGVDNSAAGRPAAVADREPSASSRRRRPSGARHRTITRRASRWTTPSISRDKVLPAMAAVRTLGDKLEGVVADDLWPLPTYREMLFIK